MKFLEYLIALLAPVLKVIEVLTTILLFITILVSGFQSVHTVLSGQFLKSCAHSLICILSILVLNFWSGI